MCACVYNNMCNLKKIWGILHYEWYIYNVSYYVAQWEECQTSIDSGSWVKSHLVPISKGYE